MKAYRFNEEDTVVTTGSLDEAKQWYAEETGEDDNDIEELDPEKDEMFCLVENTGQPLVPMLEASLHQFSLIDGKVYEWVTIKEAWERDGSPDGTHIIAHQG